MGIAFDNITATHSIKFGTPQPTDNWVSDAEPTFKTTGQYTFDLAKFPAGDLPSGGLSKRISPSEMVMCYIRADNYDPKDDSIIFRWYKNAKSGDSKLIAETTTPDYKEDPSWTWYYSWDYSFVGHFDWEINEPGSYSCHIITKWGDAWIDFNVIDTSAPSQATAKISLHGPGVVKVNGTAVSAVVTDPGLNVTFTAVPNSGSKFIKFVDFYGKEITTNPLTLRVDSDGQIDAYFESTSSPPPTPPPTSPPPPATKCPKGKEYKPGLTEQFFGCKEKGYALNYASPGIPFISDYVCVCQEGTENPPSDKDNYIMYFIIGIILLLLFGGRR